MTRQRRSPGARLAKGAASLLSIALLSCASSPPLVPAPSTTPEAHRPQGAPDLRVALRAPAAIAIDDTAIGMNEGTVAVTITNVGREAARLGVVHVTFHVHYGDVELPCVPRKPDFADNAGLLPPGESFTVMTSLGCWTPIAGDYRARAIVSFDSAGASAKTAEALFTVHDPRGRAARQSPTHPGVFALAGGDTRSLPVSEGKAVKGQYGITVVVTNANAAAVSLPEAIVSLRVYRLGEEIPCIGETFARTVPPLATGAVEVVRVPVTCIRDSPGDYVVVTHVAFKGEGEASELEAGRVRVKITRDTSSSFPWESPHGDRDRW